MSGQMWKPVTGGSKKGSSAFDQVPGASSFKPNGYYNPSGGYGQPSSAPQNHHGNQSSFNTSSGSFHPTNQKYQQRPQYQVKKPGASSSTSSAASGQFKCHDVHHHNGKPSRNGKVKDLDVKVKPFRLDKSD